eukprot:6148-Prorocentrum_minimum.AAC.2
MMCSLDAVNATRKSRHVTAQFPVYARSFNVYTGDTFSQPRMALCRHHLARARSQRRDHLVATVVGEHGRILGHHIVEHCFVRLDDHDARVKVLTVGSFWRGAAEDLRNSERIEAKEFVNVRADGHVAVHEHQGSVHKPARVS